MNMITLSEKYKLLGRYNDSKKIIDETLNICRKNFGENDSRTVICKLNLADVYYRTGKYKAADEIILNIENQNKDIIESDKNLNYKLALTKFNGGLRRNEYLALEGIFAYFFASFDSIPSEALIETLELTQGHLFANSTVSNIKSVLPGLNVFGMDNSLRLRAMLIVAEDNIDSNDLNTARIILEQALELSKNFFGENNFYEWKALNVLAKIYRMKGNISVALDTDKKAMQIAEKVCGKNSVEKFISLNAISEDYTAIKNFNEAVKIREKTLFEYKKIFEMEDVNIWQMKKDLAKNYISIGRYTESVKLCDEVLNSMKQSMKTNQGLFKDISETLEIKAKALKNSGNYEGASKVYNELILSYENTRIYMQEDLGATDADKMRWFANIIQTYKDSAVVNLDEKVEHKNFAFYCAELCKGRNLIDRYSDILVSKGYLLRREEKRELEYYEYLINSGEDVERYAGEINDTVLLSNTRAVNFTLHQSEQTYKESLRKKYSDNMIPKDPQKRAEMERKKEQGVDVFANFDLNKNRQAIPNHACFVEFMKVSDDTVLAFVLKNNADVEAVNISVDKDFFEKCQLYHELNAYADIKGLHDDGKYIWKTRSGYKITIGRNTPEVSAISMNNNSDWHNLRKELSEEVSRKLIIPIAKFTSESSHWIISPDAELNIIPFETLIYHDKMLIESVDVSYVPSLAVLNLMKKREKKILISD